MIQALDLDGRPEAVRRIAVEQPGTPSLRPTASSLFVVLQAGATAFALVRVDAEDHSTLVGETDSPILGPVEADGAPYVVIEGVLHSAQDRLTPLETPRRVTCLGETAELGPYLCAQTVIYSLSPGGAFGALRFDLADVTAPLADVPGCRAEWLDFASEAGLDLGGDPPDPPIRAPVAHAARLERRKVAVRSASDWSGGGACSRTPGGG